MKTQVKTKIKQRNHRFLNINRYVLYILIVKIYYCYPIKKKKKRSSSGFNFLGVHHKSVLNPQSTILKK